MKSDQLFVISLQAEVAELQVQAQQTRGLVYEVEREDVDLKHKLGHLDATLRRFGPEQIRAIKVCISHGIPNPSAFLLRSL